MWNQQVILTENDENGYRVDVVFSDGKTKFVKTYYPSSLEELQSDVSSELESRNVEQDLKLKIAVGNPLSLTGEVIVVVETDAEKAKKAYREIFIQYMRLLKAKSLGLPVSDVTIASLNSQIQKGWLDDYLLMVDAFARN